MLFREHLVNIHQVLTQSSVNSAVRNSGSETFVLTRKLNVAVLGQCSRISKDVARKPVSHNVTTSPKLGPVKLPPRIVRKKYQLSA
jgi:hypothetical protein